MLYNIYCKVDKQIKLLYKKIKKRTVSKMKKYVIFTNIYEKPANTRYFKNQNRFATYHAATKEEAKTIIEEVKKNGFTVTAIKTAMGNRVTL